MRKLVGLFWVVSAATLSVAAQDYTRAEISGSYSYLHSSFGGAGLSFNGASSATTVNLTRWIGLTADFGWYHNKNRNVSPGVSNNNFTYLFGPRLAFHGSQRATPFFHVLAGGSRLSSTFPPTIANTFTLPGGVRSSNSLAMAVGGGVDASLSPGFAIRVVQIDYLLTKFQDGQNDRQNNVRFSAGLVFRWGGTTSPGK